MDGGRIRVGLTKILSSSHLNQLTFPSQRRNYHLWRFSRYGKILGSTNRHPITELPGPRSRRPLFNHQSSSFLYHYHLSVLIKSFTGRDSHLHIRCRSKSRAIQCNQNFTPKRGIIPVISPNLALGSVDISTASFS